jgi:hypothetical protein
LTVIIIGVLLPMMSMKHLPEAPIIGAVVGVVVAIVAPEAPIPSESEIL